MEQRARFSSSVATSAAALAVALAATDCGPRTAARGVEELILP